MSQIIEIGFEIDNAEEYEFLEKILFRCRFKFYVEPANKFKTLEELEAECEGK